MQADLTDIVRVVDLVGVGVHGLLGGEITRHERLDPVGFAVLAILSGLGGGMIRDTLLQGGPPVALTDTWYLIVAGWTLPGESARVGVRAIKRRYPRQSF